MRRHLHVVLTVVMGAALLPPLRGATITERNDLFTMPPDYATFRGTSAAPGIESRWIPYGTYTDGTGGTEYLRVTSNLIGVVASVFDGYWERLNVPQQGFEPDEHATYRYIYFAALPPGVRELQDDGEFLRATNGTLRVVDAINATSYIYCHIGRLTPTDGAYQYYYNDWGDNVERAMALAWTYDSSIYPGGRSVVFGSRALDALVGDPSPPIPSSWTPELPFKAVDLAAWRDVFATFGDLSPDLHFFPTNATATWKWALRDAIDEFRHPNYWAYWGGDVEQAADDLVAALKTNCIPLTVEDVLSADTGWKYNPVPKETNSYWTVSTPMGNFRLDPYYGGGDYSLWDNFYSGDRIDEYYVELMSRESVWDVYVFPPEPGLSPIYQYSMTAPSAADNFYFPDISASRTRLYDDSDDYTHWRNGTTRLDWKRLGLICQLERQMEVTYEQYDEDFLPLYHATATGYDIYEGRAMATITQTSGIKVGDVVGSVTLSDYTWTAKTNYIDVAATHTNVWSDSSGNLHYDGGWSYPTAHTPGEGGCGVRIQETGASAHGQIVIHPYRDLEPGSYYIYNVGFTSDGFRIAGDWTTNDWESSEWFDVEVPFEYVINLETNETITSIKTYSKSAEACYTAADRPAQTIARLRPFPSTNVWSRGYVARQTRPRLETILAAQGRSAYMDGMTSFDNGAALLNGPGEPSWGLDWDYLPGRSTYRDRQFRYVEDVAPAGYAETLASSNARRFGLLSSLNAEVMAKFAAVAGGAAPDFPARFAAVTASDRSSLDYRMRGRTVDVTVQGGVFGGVEIYTWQTFDVTDRGEVRDPLELVWYDADGFVHGYALTGDYGYIVGSWGLQVPEYTDALERSGMPVRVDGHGDQEVKTLWRFKNLRDPNL